MVARLLLNANGLRVSAPGVDVASGAASQMLFDPSYWLAQPCVSGQTAVSPGASVSVPLPASLAGASRLFVWLNVAAFSGGSMYDLPMRNMVGPRGYVSGGVITVTFLWAYLDSAPTYYVQWTIFKGRY